MVFWAMWRYGATDQFFLRNSRNIGACICRSCGTLVAPFPVLSFLFLSWLPFSRLVLHWPVLTCPFLSCLVCAFGSFLVVYCSFLVASCLVFCPGMSWLIFSRLVLSCLSLPYPVFSWLILSYLFFPCLVLAFHHEPGG